ncbi:MAG TPA: STAS domain-containing protein [Anaerolineae bacterium]|nr:STAS domain-containing protein [Anaerolineae bacterium]
MNGNLGRQYGRSIFSAEVMGYLNNVLLWLKPDKLSMPVRQEASPVEAGQAKTHLTVTQMSGTTPVMVLQLHGALNAANYLDLISAAKEIYAAGGRNLIFDMSQVPSIGLSGFFALYSMAVLLRGEEPPDAAGGWGTLRANACDMQTRGLQEHFKLLNPRPEVEQALEQSGFKAFLEIQPNLKMAMASF